MELGDWYKVLHVPQSLGFVRQHLSLKEDRESPTLHTRYELSEVRRTWIKFTYHCTCCWSFDCLLKFRHRNFPSSRSREARFVCVHQHWRDDCGFAASIELATPFQSLSRCSCLSLIEPKLIIWPWVWWLALCVGDRGVGDRGFSRNYETIRCSVDVVIESHIGQQSHTTVSQIGMTINRLSRQFYYKLGWKSKSKRCCKALFWLRWRSWAGFKNSLTEREWQLWCYWTKADKCCTGRDYVHSFQKDFHLSAN